jgi:hypothetical protein
MSTVIARWVPFSSFPRTDRFVVRTARSQTSSLKISERLPFELWTSFRFFFRSSVRQTKSHKFQRKKTDKLGDHFEVGDIFVWTNNKMSELLIDPPDDVTKWNIVPNQRDILRSDEVFLRPNFVGRSYPDLETYVDKYFSNIMLRLRLRLRRAILCRTQVLDNRNPLHDKRTQITWIILKNSSAVMCVFLKLFVHELLYKFIDSIDLKWCIGHWFTHPVIKNWF